MIDTQAIRDDKKKIVAHMKALLAQRGVVVLDDWNKRHDEPVTFSISLGFLEFKRRGVRCIANFWKWEILTYAIINTYCVWNGYPDIFFISLSTTR